LAVLESVFRKEHAMRRQFHLTSAAAAMTFVLCIAGLSFVVLALLPATLYTDQAFLITPIRSTAHNLAKAACLILLLGYAVGIVGWLATLVIGCDGMHRLASVLNGGLGRN
jgi:hypothetical protein